MNKYIVQLKNDLPEIDKGRRLNNDERQRRVILIKANTAATVTALEPFFKEIDAKVVSIMDNISLIVIAVDPGQIENVRNHPLVERVFKNRPIHLINPTN